MSDERILIVSPLQEMDDLLAQAILIPEGYPAQVVADGQALKLLLREQHPGLVLVDERLEGSLELVAWLAENYPALPVIWLSRQPEPARGIEALRSGAVDALFPPLHASQVLQAARRALQRGKRLNDWTKLENRRSTRSLQQRIDGLEALQQIGRTVTGQLDLDSVLQAVVEAAVSLSGAEEGSLMLLDENSGELYIRAARNLEDAFVRTFRLPAEDNLPGEVLRSRQPLVFDGETPLKINTSYLVHSGIVMPLLLKDRAVGVLSVTNRTPGSTHQSRRPFSATQVAQVAALAGYAAIAIENARLYANSELERQKLETILTSIADAVIVVDSDGRLVLVNETARQVFAVATQQIVNRPAQSVFQHPDLLELLELSFSDQPSSGRSTPLHCEIVLEDGRVFNAQLTPIPEVGSAITMQDITHLKELDHIKSDFVNTVSHDLRSPLTAILGYVELLERVGTVNKLQADFIQRIQLSVHSITALINDLLDLGRIEAGFDSRKEIAPLGAIILYAVHGLAELTQQRSQELSIDAPEGLPMVLGNPIRLKQMVQNLVLNAIKYTPRGGRIQVSARAEGGQFILRVSDNGPGIPPAEQPYIFDKFYRASNVPLDTPGTGLGLAIVKSIVDDHRGRIWVDSALGQGSSFTVVLEVVE